MVNVGGQLVIGPAAPTVPAHAARKDYVDGTAITVVASSASVSSPTTNQMIYDLALEMIRRWNGSWIDVCPGYGGGLSTTQKHEFDYSSSGQSIASNSPTTINWNNANLTADDLTVAAGGTTGTTSVSNGKFTINRGGLWNFAVFGVSAVPTTIANVVCIRMVDVSGNVFLGSGSRTCQSDGGPIRLVAGQALYVAHTQQSGSSSNFAGEWRGAFLRG